MAVTLSRLAIDLLVNSEGLQKEFNKALRPLNKFASQAKAIGKDLSLKATAPILGIGATMLRSAGDFEAGMFRVQALTGATSEQFEHLSMIAKELGATTQFSATEAAAGIEMLSKNGLKYQQIADGALSSTLRLSAATGADLSRAADIATDAMLAFGIGAGEMEHAVNGITGVTINSKFDIEEYANALAAGGAVAASVGRDFNEFNATIAAMAPSFSSGETAGTALKVFMQRLVPGSDAAQAAMDRLGLSFFDAQGNMDDLATVAGKLQVALKGVSEEQKISDLSEIFGTRGIIAATSLAQAGEEQIRKLQETLSNTSALEQAEARMKGLNGALTKMKSAMEAVAIAVAESGLLEAVTAIATKFAEVFGKVSQTNPELLRVVTIAAAVVAAIGPLVLAIGNIAAALAPVIALISAKGGLIVSFALLSNPIGILVAALGGLTAAWILWKDEIIEFLSNVGARLILFWEEVTKALTTVKEKVADMARFAIDQFVGLADKIRETMAGILDTVAETVQGIKVWLQDKLQSILQAPGKAIDALGNKFKSLFNKVVGNSYVPDMVDRLGQEFERMNQIFIQPSKAAIETLDEAFDASALDIGKKGFELNSTDFAIKGLGDLEDTTDGAQGEARDLGRILGDYERVGGQIGNVINRIKEGTDGGVEGVIDFATDVAGTFKSLFDDLDKMGDSFKVSDIFGGKDGGGLFQSIGNIFNGGGGGGGLFKSIGNIFGGGGGGGSLLGGIGKAIGGFLNPIGSLFGGFFARGGTTPVGRSLAVVGENGPEFIASASRSRVFPTDSIATVGAGTKGTTTVVVNLHQENNFESGTTVEQVAAMMNQHGSMLVKSIADQISRGGATRKAFQN